MNEKCQKPYRLGLIEMYFKDDKQISLFEFGQKAGLKLDRENRWIKKSELIDWDKIEDKYAYLYSENNGARAKLIRTALAALIIKQEESFSDESTVVNGTIKHTNLRH
jgi:hypothetical protein